MTTNTTPVIVNNTAKIWLMDIVNPLMNNNDKARVNMGHVYARADNIGVFLVNDKAVKKMSNALMPMSVDSAARPISFHGMIPLLLREAIMFLWLNNAITTNAIVNPTALKQNNVVVDNLFNTIRSMTSIAPHKRAVTSDRAMNIFILLLLHIIFT